MLATGVFLLFWWPLSHWFYPDAYHQFLGFKPGSYQDDMVKVIGTTGMMPVLMMLFSAMDPVRNRHMVLTIIAFSVLLAATYAFLVATGQFPAAELANVAFSAGAALFLIVVYPWRGEAETSANSHRRTKSGCVLGHHSP